MRVTVDYTRCASTGSCMQACPEVFTLDAGGTLTVLNEEPDESLHDAVADAADLCPMNAISVES